MNASQNPNIAFVQSMYAAFARGDVATILAGCSPGIEWRVNGSSADFPTLGLFQGKDGVANFLRLVAEHDDITSFEPRSFNATGDKVFVEGRYGITARKTGRHFESDWLHVFAVDNGRCASFCEYTDTAAFAASIK